MRAIIYAAGVGTRLGGRFGDQPKVLLEFGGMSLLERHLRILGRCGIDDVVVAAGYRAEAIEAAVAALDLPNRVRVVRNPDYRAGSIVTQWAVRGPLGEGGGVLLMDGDVLYDRRLIDRLVGSAHANCFLLDRDIEAGDEPVKLCVRDGHLVDFRKQPEQAHDWHGESVGFFRLDAVTAARLVAQTQAYVDAGRTGDYYDEALRDLLIADAPGAFGFEDITGLPWREIDFPDDVARAKAEVLPRLLEPDA